MGKNIGGSLLEKSMVPVALKMINKARMKNINLVLPIDVLTSNSIDSKLIEVIFQLRIFLKMQWD